jgi:ADP-dependent NAD(P)H-hydrate dehydratase / NAD(P)H-hydrate epimerase
MLILTAQEMAGFDQQTIKTIGIPGIVLMENAARGAAEFFIELFPDMLNSRIAVIAGTGNNAGDGFVLARIFHTRGAQVRVFCLRSPGKLSGDALTNFNILERLGVPVTIWDEAEDFEVQWHQVGESDFIIDAILGTGLKTEVRGLYREIIDEINTFSGPVLAVDVPSGLDASSGRPLGSAVKAAATATFGFLKIGHVVEPGTDLVGQVRVVDIGIPPDVAKSANIRRYWLTEKFLSRWLEPRQPDTHKGNAGHVCVLSGSRGKTGAATLISLGAARAGAGLVTLFIPESLNPILEAKLTEAMTFPIRETEDQGPAFSALPEILEFIEGKQTLAMGPGISTGDESVALVKELLLKVDCPMVLDADAITAVSDDPAILRKASAPLILTPHPGEMARICGCSVPEVQQNRLEIAARFSAEYGVVLVLNGHRTVIAGPDGELAINSTGNPAMASGGMGDTLTGIIAGFLAQGFAPFKAACLGVFVHGAAADRVIAGVASRGLLATDMLAEVPAVIGILEGFQENP